MVYFGHQNLKQSCRTTIQKEINNINICYNPGKGQCDFFFMYQECNLSKTDFQNHRKRKELAQQKI